MTAFVDLFGGVLDSNTQKVNTADILGGKVVGIYFGANWCRECQAFTQYLRDYYNHQKAEVCFCVIVQHQLRCPRECCLLLLPPPCPLCPRTAGTHAVPEVMQRFVTLECSAVLTVRSCSAHTSVTRGGGVGWGRGVIVMGSTQTLPRNQEEEARGR